MSVATNNRLTRIGVFYDGMYFKHVSDYYNYAHDRKARIDISGLHRFLRKEISERENNEYKFCQIVDAHYFRGRLSATEAERHDILLKERSFEDVLMSEGVTTHFLLLQPAQGEKGIDVWFSLEAFELAIYKRYDVCVLITGDADYVPLARKLNTIGTRVMLLAWDFEYTDPKGNEKTTKTAQALIDEVTYPVMMANVIDDRAKKNTPEINDLFLSGNQNILIHKPDAAKNDSKQKGKVININNARGFAFIKPDYGTDNVFFHFSKFVDGNFLDLKNNDNVEFYISEEAGENEKGPSASEVRKI